jgi:uncharacterized protein with HEPN domain
MRRDESYLLDILTAARRAISHLDDVQSKTFEESDLLQDAVVRALEVVGEAAGHISAEYRESHPEIPWHKMIGMRNRLIHEYFRVNYAAVWDTVTNDLPDLVKTLEKLVPPE